jgi:hypothetical protein
MKTHEVSNLPLSHELIEAIRNFPRVRTVEHCGSSFALSPFEIYAQCPHCSQRLKVRSFAAVTELEDLFDAVFEWMNDPQAAEFAAQRMRVIATDAEE